MKKWMQDQAGAAVDFTRAVMTVSATDERLWLNTWRAAVENNKGFFVGTLTHEKKITLLLALNQDFQCVPHWLASSDSEARRRFSAVGSALFPTLSPGRAFERIATMDAAGMEAACVMGLTACTSLHKFHACLDALESRWVDMTPQSQQMVEQCTHYLAPELRTRVKSIRLNQDLPRPEDPCERRPRM